MDYIYNKDLINVQKLDTELKNISSAVNGISVSGTEVVVHCDEELLENVLALIESAISDHDPVDVPTLEQIVQEKIQGAVLFGESVLDEFKKENVLMGISQAGKTKAVSDFLHRLDHYLNSGSLYAAVEEINAVLAGTIPTSLAPFVTTTRMTDFANKIRTYLNLPLI